MRKKIASTFLITTFFTIRTLAGWGSEPTSLSRPVISKQFGLSSGEYCLTDTVPPKKTEQQIRDIKDESLIQKSSAKGPVNNATVTVQEEIKTIREVPKSKKKIKPVKIDVVPLPQNIIKPKIIIKKIKI